MCYAGCSQKKKNPNKKINRTGIKPTKTPQPQKEQILIPMTIICHAAN